jgi:electron transfer flavoprotein alpha subunit
VSVLVLLEHDRGSLSDATLEALTFARDMGSAVHGLLPGGDPELASRAADYGAEVVHHARHDLLSDYGPEAWGETLAQVAKATGATVVVACGTDRGNEVVAQAACRLDLPFVANCLAVTPGDGEWTIDRVRWGGSLIERTALEAPVKLLTLVAHSVEPEPASAAGVLEPFEPVLDPSLARTMVVDRVVLSQGMTLATAPVVVGGGRGVGSAEGFAPLEELAGLLGGVVGCSRVVTNNGWRPHTDQVGQTGTRIAPDIYIACGISGAIQHWVGAMAAKTILAINTDQEANMVTKADYAVIGDLHEIILAITAEIRKRR